MLTVPDLFLISMLGPVLVPCYLEATEKREL